MAPDGIKAENFLAVLPQLGNLTGAGTTDSKNNLDFKMIATLSKSAGASSGGGAAGGLGGILGKVAGAGCNSGMTVPFQIKGTTSDPKFVPDVGGIAADMFKSKLGCLGGAGNKTAGTDQQQNPNNPVDAITGLFKKKKP